MQKSTFALFAMVIAVLAGMVSVQAQEQTILIVVVPDFWRNLVEDSDALMADFEAQYAVDVQIEYSNNGLGFGPTDSDSVEEYSDSLAEYLELGDVIYAEESWLSPEVTRSGYVVDLMPLINADMNLNPNDFYPTVWQSFQWDGGMWAIPTSAETLFVDYVPEAFADAGIAYPNANWTIDDFANAARELTKYDDNNEVELAGAQISNQAREALFYAFMGHGYYDSSAYPETPALNSPDLAYILEVWNELLDEGVLVAGFAGRGAFGQGNNDIPIRIGSGGEITIVAEDDSVAPPGGLNFNADAPERALAPLPNGFAVLQTNGFAISSGTQNPQLAYELLRYLSEQQAVANADATSEAARISYFTDAVDSPFTVTVERSDADAALVQDALYNGVPTSELRFSRYLNSAVNSVRSGTDAVTALQEAELDALATVDAMSNLTVNLTVALPASATVSQDQIVLNFQMVGFGPALANQAEWDALATEFAAQDPEVGAVTIEQLGGRQQATGDIECAYYSNTTFVSIDPETMLVLDPLLFSDMNYNVNDLPVGALELMQVNGMTYGLPMTLQPLMLTYNPDMFAQAGLPEPVGGWTISEFGNALEMLQFVVEEGDPSFSPQGNTTAALLMLIAAEGGMPIDYSTNPPTLNFNTSENVVAIETVLDWVKAGYIEFSGTGGFGGGGGQGGGFGANNSAPISASFFGGGRGQGGGFGENNNSSELTTYPVGINTPVAFDVGAGYISNDMAYPEACYRWLSYVATHPYIFTTSMPALVSKLNDSLVVDTLGNDTIAAYQQVADMLNDPSVLSINSNDPFILTWLGWAFDAYVQEDADLMTELELAQQYTADYLSCTASLDESATRFDLQSCIDVVDSAAS